MKKQSKLSKKSKQQALEVPEYFTQSELMQHFGSRK